MAQNSKFFMFFLETGETMFNPKLGNLIILIFIVYSIQLGLFQKMRPLHVNTFDGKITLLPYFPAGKLVIN